MTVVTVDAWFGAFAARDIEAAPLADDFTHTSPFGVIEGRQAYLEMVSANPDGFYGAEIEIVDTLASGEVSVVRYLVNGSPATDWIYSRNGEITAIHSHYHFGPPPSF